MKILLYIYLGVSITSLILFKLTSLAMSRIFKARYPDLKPPKTSFIEKLGTIFKALLIHFMPILNVLLLFIYLFDEEKIVERSIEKMYSKLSKEGTDGRTDEH
jgi:hypothetical protein